MRPIELLSMIIFQDVGSNRGCSESAREPVPAGRLLVEVKDDEIVLYGDRVGLHPHTRRVERPAGSQVELPAVPGTFENLALTLEANLASRLGDNVRTNATVTKWPAAVRADVAQCDELAAKVKDPDSLATADREDSPLARRNLVDSTENAPAADNLEGARILDTENRRRLR